MPACIKNKKGFTLIELLVVIAIIALLASIIFANLQDARKRAKDASLKESVNQLATLAELNYNTYGNYANLQLLNADPTGFFVGWVGTNSGEGNNVYPCSVLNNGIYGPNAVAICEEIIKNGVPIEISSGVDSSYGYLFVGQNPRGTLHPQNVTVYSFYVYLNKVDSASGRNFIYCAGNSGARGEYLLDPLMYYKWCFSQQPYAT